MRVTKFTTRGRPPAAGGPPISNLQYQTIEPCGRVETRYERLVRLSAEEQARAKACRDAAIFVTVHKPSPHPMRRTAYSVRICEPNDICIDSKSEKRVDSFAEKWEPVDGSLTPERVTMPIDVLQELFDRLVEAGAIQARKGGAQ